MMRTLIHALMHTRDLVPIEALNIAVWVKYRVKKYSSYLIKRKESKIML